MTMEGLTPLPGGLPRYDVGDDGSFHLPGHEGHLLGKWHVHAGSCRDLDRCISDVEKNIKTHRWGEAVVKAIQENKTGGLVLGFKCWWVNRTMKSLTSKTVKETLSKDVDVGAVKTLRGLRHVRDKCEAAFKHIVEHQEGGTHDDRSLSVELKHNNYINNLFHARHSNVFDDAKRREVAERVRDLKELLRPYASWNGSRSALPENVEQKLREFDELLDNLSVVGERLSEGVSFKSPEEHCSSLSTLKGQMEKLPLVEKEVGSLIDSLEHLNMHKDRLRENINTITTQGKKFDGVCSSLTDSLFALQGRQIALGKEISVKGWIETVATARAMVRGRIEELELDDLSISSLMEPGYKEHIDRVINFDTSKLFVDEETGKDQQEVIKPIQEELKEVEASVRSAEEEIFKEPIAEFRELVSVGTRRQMLMRNLRDIMQRPELLDSPQGREVQQYYATLEKFSLDLGDLGERCGACVDLVGKGSREQAEKLLAEVKERGNTADFVEVREILEDKSLLQSMEQLKADMQTEHRSSVDIEEEAGRSKNTLLLLLSEAGMNVKRAEQIYSKLGPQLALSRALLNFGQLMIFADKFGRDLPDSSVLERNVRDLKKRFERWKTEIPNLFEEMKTLMKNENRTPAENERLKSICEQIRSYSRESAEDRALLEGNFLEESRSMLETFLTGLKKQMSGKKEHKAEMKEINDALKKCRGSLISRVKRGVMRSQSAPELRGH